MADCTGLVQKILSHSHLKKEFHVQICPLKVGATGPHKLGNLSIWDEKSKDGKDHRSNNREDCANLSLGKKLLKIIFIIIINIKKIIIKFQWLTEHDHHGRLYMFIWMAISYLLNVIVLELQVLNVACVSKTSTKI